MDILDILTLRHSCRNYSSEKVSHELLHQLITLAGQAPSAANHQAYRVYLFTNNDWLFKVHQVYPREWIKTAPAVILICAQKEQGWVRGDGKNHAEIDSAIFADHLTLLSTSFGLATCWVCNFDRELSIRLFQLSSNLEPIVFIPLGYPIEKEVPKKKRKNSNEYLLIDKTQS